MPIFSRIAPFIVLGIMLVILIAGFILLSYLLIVGAVLGLVLFVLAWAKEKFFPGRNLPTVKREARTFEHDDSQNP